MTLPLLKVAELGEESPVQFNFDQIAKLFLDTGGESVRLRFGTGTVTGTGARDGSVNITHGMGSTPLVALVVPQSNSFAGSADTLGGTTFRAKLNHLDSGSTFNDAQTIYWAALG